MLRGSICTTIRDPVVDRFEAANRQSSRIYWSGISQPLAWHASASPAIAIAHNSARHAARRPWPFASSAKAYRPPIPILPPSLADPTLALPPTLTPAPPMLAPALTPTPPTLLPPTDRPPVLAPTPTETVPWLPIDELAEAVELPTDTAAARAIPCRMVASLPLPVSLRLPAASTVAL